MKAIRKIIDKYITIEKVSKSSLILNLASIIYGIIYIILSNVGIVYVFLVWDIFGVVLLLTFFENLLLIILNTSKLNKNSKVGKKFVIINLFYLLFIIIGMFLMYQGNWDYMTCYSNNLDDNLLSLSYIYIGYFGILLFGTTISLFDLKYLNRKELWDLETIKPKAQSKSIRIIKILLTIFCYLTLLLGIYFSYIIIFGYYIEITAFVAGMVVPELALFLLFFFLSTTILLLTLQDKEPRQRRYKAIALIGIIITGAHLLPLLSSPYAFYSGEASFTEAFGAGWQEKIDPDIEEKYFMKSPFWLSGYFLSIPDKDCNYEKNVEFFDGKESTKEVDEDINLYFDVFWPKKVKDELPGVKDGKCSIIIFIHGGAWKYGDKSGSKIPSSKYFAAQGYVVYDIQYGLKDDPFEALKTPENVKGDFDVNDMVRHIGNFTHYISKDSNEYSAKKLDADLESVFVSGGSAGGHLTLATALGIESGEYDDIFGSAIKIRGIIPFYPGHPSNLEGDKRLKYPEKYLIENNSPPCLIHQGTHDPICLEISQGVKEEYDKAGNDECCIIYLPFSGHSNDIYRPAYFNQIFTYYMERFMFLCIEGEIK